MKLTFLGAAHEVTGSCTLLEACGKKMLIDFGMEQGPDIYENSEIPVSPAEIDFVFLTHAHIDHSGKLPLLTIYDCGNRESLRHHACRHGTYPGIRGGVEKPAGKAFGRRRLYADVYACGRAGADAVFLHD